MPTPHITYCIDLVRIYEMLKIKRGTPHNCAH